MKHRALFVLCPWMFATAFCGAEIGIGDTRDVVLREVGKPASTARRGDHEIFLYPKGGRIEFIGGKVADVKGPLPTPAPLSPEPASPEAEATQPSAPAPPDIKGGQATPLPKSPAGASSPDFNPAAAANELAMQVEKMDTAWGMAPAPPREALSPLDSLPLFFGGLALRFVFTLLALKLAFRYWEMDALWKGTLLIAAIDVTAHASLELLARVSDGFTVLVPVENGITALILVFTIHRFCFNKRIQDALVTAFAVKLVVTLCYLFAGLAMLNLVFS